MSEVKNVKAKVLSKKNIEKIKATSKDSPDFMRNFQARGDKRRQEESKKEKK